MKNFLSNFVGSRLGKVTLMAALMVVGCGVFAEDAAAAAKIPVIGVSVEKYIEAAITLMGTVAGTAVGGYAAFLVVKKALRWLGTAIR